MYICIRSSLFTAWIDVMCGGGHGNGLHLPPCEHIAPKFSTPRPPKLIPARFRGEATLIEAFTPQTTTTTPPNQPPYQHNTTTPFKHLTGLLRQNGTYCLANRTLQRLFRVCYQRTARDGAEPKIARACQQQHPSAATSSPSILQSLPVAHSRARRQDPQTNTPAKPSIPQTTNQPWTNRRKAQTSRRPSPSSTSAATAVSHSATWAISSEHAARTLLSQRSRTSRPRWAATVRILELARPEKAARARRDTY
jgi:hypothetical protein